MPPMSVQKFVQLFSTCHHIRLMILFFSPTSQLKSTFSCFLFTTLAVVDKFSPSSFSLCLI